MTSTPRVTIRPGCPQDAQILHAFVMQLATYERLEATVQSDAPALAAALTGPHPRLEAHLAEVNGQVVGVSTFFETFSTFAARPKLYLEDLIVDPSYRRLSVGRALMDALAVTARARGCTRIEWMVLDWNSPARSFYESLGAQRVTEWVPYSLIL